MLTSKRILNLFKKLNTSLAAQGEIGEIGIVGGAVMCLVYNAREATRDVDAIFEPKSIIYKLAAQIAVEEDLPDNWLNDAAKGFIQAGFSKQDVLNLSNLRVWSPEPRYLLAMKCLSARWDTSDRDDVIFLIDFLKIREPSQVFELIEGYYPKNIIPTKTKFFIEEVLSQAK